MHDLLLSWKYRPRLTTWGKLVAWWIVVSAPWMVALVCYTAGMDWPNGERFVPLLGLSVVSSGVLGFAGALACADLSGGTEWAIFKERD